MQGNKEWLKFIISGKIDDYLNYKNSLTKQQLYGGENHPIFDRRPCDKGEQYW